MNTQQVSSDTPTHKKLEKPEWGLLFEDGTARGSRQTKWEQITWPRPIDEGVMVLETERPVCVFTLQAPGMEMPLVVEPPRPTPFFAVARYSLPFVPSSFSSEKERVPVHLLSVYGYLLPEYAILIYLSSLYAPVQIVRPRPLSVSSLFASPLPILSGVNHE